MEIYGNIKKYAKAKKVTIKQLEQELNFADSQIAKWDKNVPGIEKVMAVADFLQVSMDDLLGRKSYGGEKFFVTPDEAELIKMYKTLNPDGKFTVFHVAEIMYENNKKIETDIESDKVG